MGDPTSTSTASSRRHDRPAPLSVSRAPRPEAMPLGHDVRDTDNLLEGLALQRMSAGEPFCAQTTLHLVESLHTISPAPPAATISTDHWTTWLVTGADWTFLATWRKGGMTSVQVTATTAEVADDMISAARAKVPAPIPDARAIGGRPDGAARSS